MTPQSRKWKTTKQIVVRIHSKIREPKEKELGSLRQIRNAQRARKRILAEVRQGSSRCH